MKRLILFLALCLSAQAANPFKIAARVLGNKYVTIGALDLSLAMDWRTTVHCSNLGVCREANPALIAVGAVPGTVDGTRRFGAVKGAEIAGATALYLWAVHRRPQNAKAFTLEAWAIAGAMGAVAYHNRSLILIPMVER